jgi:benzoyl-CoA reductase/2-hydroxyglutaryl-CoA dehydratase subunit BcrC/BadD/HgdB
MKAAPPPMTGRELIDLKSSISGIPCDFEQYRAALEEVKLRTTSSCMAKRTRVLMTGVPMAHGAERVLDIIEDHGGVVVAMESCTGLKPILEDVDEDADDPLVAIAEKYFHLPCSVMTPNDRRMQLLQDLATEYQPHCIIDLSWQACLTYDVESFLVKDLAEKKLGVPFLRISTDYSPSDSARIAVRVEALFETARGASA